MDGVYEYENMFAFTYKRHKGKPTDVNYRKLLSKLITLGYDVHDYQLEGGCEDNTGRYIKRHMHGTFTIPYDDITQSYDLNSCMINGFHCYFKPIKNLQGWLDYCKKGNKYDLKAYLF